MPSALDILKDPNYIKANTATKQAIFNRRVATLPEYRSANSATQADIRRRFGIETSKERYTRQQAKQRADEKSALRDTGSKIASAVSGAERGIKSVADKLSYLNPLEYIPNPFSSKKGEAAKEKRLATFSAERQQANPKSFAGGKIGGEIVATLPLTMGTGAAIQLGGRALTPVMSRAGPVIEKFGRAVTSGGTNVRAPTKAAETSGKIVAQTRKARNAYRAAGGATSSLIAAAATDQDLTDAALAGATVPVLGHILKYGAGKTYDVIMGRAGPVEAARILREVISDNATKIASALRNAPKDIKANTAEFLASRGLLTPELAAVTQIASGSKQQKQLVDLALERTKGQNRMRQIIAGGENPTEAVGNIAATKGALQTATGPMREANLRAANAGLPPLDISKVVSNLRAEADKAEFVSPDRFKILSQFADNLERRAAKMGGTIDAEGLYLARREMGNFVSSVLNTSDPKALRQGTSQLIAAAQQPIDDAIEAAGGAGWKAYLDEFSQGMKAIERQQFQRQLAELPDDQFAEVMAGGNPDYVEDFFGPGRTDINVEMQGADLATANKLGRDIQATEAVKGSGLEDLSDAQKLNFEQGLTAIVGDKLKPAGLNAFAAGARLAGSIPKVGGGGMAAQQFGEDAARKASERTMTSLVPALASPRQAGELLRVQPAEDYISKFLYGSQSAAPLTSAPRQFAPGTAAQAVANRNALTPAQQSIINQNNMSQARQQAVAQIGVEGMTPPSNYAQYGFPDFDPESGEPLIDIDFSEGYPVPIYGRVSRNMMRR
jgi:hypothetical protein